MAGAPLSTYRLQLNPAFTFDDAAEVVGYLADLGVSHVYLSPILQAVPGSTHGYDVVDPSRPSEDLGGAEGYARLTAAISAAGLKQVLDIVPNHMAITGPENKWWWPSWRTVHRRCGPTILMSPGIRRKPSCATPC